MNALVVTEYGNPKTLKFQKLKLNEPSADQVLIEVKYAGVNFPDTLIIQGKYQFQPAMPFAPGGEVAGIIKSVGQNITRFKVGDRVVSGTSWGGFAEEVLGFELNTHHLPDEISFKDGAAMLMTYGTVIHALKDRARLSENEKLVVLGAAGGVGAAAIQVGKCLGAEVIACASSEEKLVFCESIGADKTYQYTDLKFLKNELKSLTEGRGADVIFDPIGGEFSEQAFRAIANFGRYLVVGFASGKIPSIPWNLPLLKSADIVGVFWGNFFRKYPVENQANIQLLFKWMKDGKVKPTIDCVLPLDEGAKALEMIQNREVKGKILLEI